MLNWRNFRGVTSRRQFWLFVLFLAVLNTLGSNLVDNLYRAENGIRFILSLNLSIDPSETWWTNIFSIVFGLPFMAAFVRRCHDAGYKASNFLVFGIALLAIYTIIVKMGIQFTIPLPAVIIGALLFVGWMVFVLTRPSKTISRSREEEVFE